MKKRWYIIIGSVVVLLFVVLFGINAWLGSRLPQIINKQLATWSNGSYQVEIESTKVNIFNRSATLRGVKLSADTTGARKPSAYTFDGITIDRIMVRGLHWKNKDKKQLRIRTLALDAPSIRIVRDMTAAAPVDAPQRARSIYEQTAAIFEIFDVQRVRIQNADVSYRTVTAEEEVAYTLSDFTLELDGLKIDGNQENSRRLLYSDAVRTSAGKFTYLFGHSAFLLEVDSINLDSKKGTFAVGKLQLLPQYPKFEFPRHAKNNSDWTQATVGGIRFFDIDFDAYARDKTVKIDSVHIRDVELTSLKNRNIAQPYKVKHLVYESVQQLPFRLHVRRIGLENINPAYEELAVGAGTPGVINFTGINGVFSDVTNIVTSQNQYMHLHARGKLMGAGTLQADFSFPVDSTNPQFTIDGKLGAMPFTALNKIVTPLMNIRFDSGTITGMNFHITGTSLHTQSSMQFLYKDLEVDLLKYKDGKLQKRGFLSWIANGLVIRSDNPDKGGVRSATSSAERDYNRSQYNYLWRSLRGGMQSTMGLLDKGD